jgi:hypothetical protein
MEFLRFDRVVVGGGAAGTMLGARLSEHSTIEGTRFAGSWIWAVARRNIVGRPNEVKVQE